MPPDEKPPLRQTGIPADLQEPASESGTTFGALGGDTNPGEQQAIRRVGGKHQFDTIISNTRAMMSGSEAEHTVAEQKLGTDGYYRAVFALREVGGPITPERVLAWSELQSLKGDREFVKKYTSGDKDARSKLDAIQRRAFPG